MLDFLPCLSGLAATAAVRWADLNPGLEGLLLLGNDGCGHVKVPRLEGIRDDDAMSDLNTKLKLSKYP